MIRLLLLLCMGVATSPLHADAGPLRLQTAIDLAVRTDPWQTRSTFRERALADQAVAAAALPDPRMSVMAANFPSDTFDIQQEPMTQVVIGVSQMFPRGDTLMLARQQKDQLSLQEPMLRADRQAKVRSVAAQLWLDVFKAQESIRLIEADRDLFDQLADAALVSYSSAFGRTRQTDLIRAQLELTRLDDRLTVLHQQLQSSQRRLSEWIGVEAINRVSPSLPTQSVNTDLDWLLTEPIGDEALYEQIRQHPALIAIDRRIDAQTTGVDLARQKYKPEWGLAAQYGYRANDPSGRERADLFSVGVTFDLPVFSRHRQDKEVSAALALTDAVRAEKDLIARQLMAELRSVLVQAQRVSQRQTLYATQLLPQMADQAEASLAAYDNDDGDFAEAVRARIAELNAKIDSVAIAVENLQLSFRLDYLVTQAFASDERMLP